MVRHDTMPLQAETGQYALMYPEIEEILNRDTELAKQFYRFDRGKTIAQLWNNTSDKGVQLNVNNIIRIVNQIGPNE